jgi:SCY1-like protein 1
MREVKGQSCSLSRRCGVERGAEERGAWTRKVLDAPSRAVSQPQANQWGRCTWPRRCCAGTSLAHRPAHQCPDFVVIVMDFLKSAVASAISKGPAFGYTFGDRVDLNDSIWTLHNGTKRVWPGRLHAHAHLLANLGASGRRLQM